MKKYFKNAMILAIIIISFSSCRKITTPNEESKKIFGSWTYINNSGGFSGMGGSSRFKSDSWVQFTERGFFKTFIGSSKVNQKRFKIEMKESIYDSNQRPALVYFNRTFETYHIFNDTLFINDEAYDGYSYMFIKK